MDTSSNSPLVLEAHPPESKPMVDIQALSWKQALLLAAGAVACGLSAAVAFRVGRMRRPRAGRAGVKWLLLKPAGMGFRALRRASG